MEDLSKALLLISFCIGLLGFSVEVSIILVGASYYICDQFLGN